MAARSAPKTILEHPSKFYSLLAFLVTSANILGFRLLLTEQDILPPNSRSAEEYKQLAADCFQRAEQALQGVSMELRTKPRMALLVGKRELYAWSADDLRVYTACCPSNARPIQSSFC